MGNHRRFWVWIATWAFLFAWGGVRAEWVWDVKEGWINLGEAPSDSAHGLYVYGRGLFIRGDYAAAEEVFRGIETRFPKSPEAAKARFGRARCEGRLGRLSRAFEMDTALLSAGGDAVDKGEILDHQMELARELGRRDRARAGRLCGQVAERATTPERRVAARMTQGEMLFEAREYDPAREAFEKAALLAPAGEDRLRALWQAALADVRTCREAGHDAARLRRARGHFERYLADARDTAQAKTARQYLRVIGDLLQEKDAQRQRVYYAVTYVLERRCDKAYGSLKRAARRFQGTRVGEEARFFQAECLFLQKALWDAYKCYEDFLEQYPGSPRVRSAVGREFEAGKGLKALGKLSKALYAFRSVIARDPSGPFADDAQMEVGLCHLAAGKCDDAREAFDAVIADYPQSSRYYAAVFYGGKADLMESPYRSDNEMLLARAERSFEAYLERNAGGRLAPEAKRLVTVCRARLAERTMAIARFYARRGHEAAATVYYRMMAKDYPGTPQAREAEALLGGGRRKE